MILGFGNNVVSSLASDITASQTTFSVLPGDGPLFAALLTSDFSNKSTTLKNYAKITLTDSGETAFEVCHLTAVNGDTLTVIRGQEGTAAKGWALKDVVANFATRGSENAFPQIAHIQSGFYTSGTAGGTANALTLELPTTFFLNGSADWVLKTPIVVYPSQNNTGAATLHLTMGGRVLGTFKLYKGNKAELVANDILKDVALVCLLDNTRTFFNVANPGAIYAGLGSAAFANLVTSKTDATTGRVPVVGWMGLGGYGTDILLSAADAKKPLRNGFYGVQSEPTYGNASLISFGYDSGSQVHIIAKQGGQAPLIGLAGSTPQGDFGNWGKIYTEFQKPTAIEVGAVPYRGALGTVDLNTIRGTQYGRFNQSMTANATTARNYPIAEAGALDVHQTSANGPESCVQEYRSFNSRRIFLRSYNQSDSAWTGWCEFYTTAKKPTAGDVGALPITGGTLNGNLSAHYYRATQRPGAGSFASQYTNLAPFYQEFASASTSEYNPLWKQKHTTGHMWSGGMLVNAESFAIQYISSNGNNILFTFAKDGQFVPGSYANFDTRYLLADSASNAGFASGDATRPYMRHRASNAVVELAKKGDAYTKAESDGRYQAKGNYISGMRLGTQGSANNNNGGWAMAPNGAVLTGSYQDANYTAVYYRYPQYQLNGSSTWYNTGAA